MTESNGWVRLQSKEEIHAYLVAKNTEQKGNLEEFYKLNVFNPNKGKFNFYKHIEDLLIYVDYNVQFLLSENEIDNIKNDLKDAIKKYRNIYELQIYNKEGTPFFLVVSMITCSDWHKKGDVIEANIDFDFGHQIKKERNKYEQCLNIFKRR